MLVYYVRTRAPRLLARTVDGDDTRHYSARELLKNPHCLSNISYSLAWFHPPTNAAAGFGFFAIRWIFPAVRVSLQLPTSMRSTVCLDRSARVAGAIGVAWERRTAASSWPHPRPRWLLGVCRHPLRQPAAR